MMGRLLRHILLLIGLALPLVVSALGAIPDHPETGGQEALCMPDSAETPRMDAPAAWSFPVGESRIGRTRSHSSTSPRIGGPDISPGMIPDELSHAGAGAYVLPSRARWHIADARYRLLYPFHDFW